jgi:hypothetical protein
VSQEQVVLSPAGSTYCADDIERDNRPGCLVYKPDNSKGHQAPVILALVSAPPALMATFTASSIGSLKGTSTRSRPCS